MIRPAEKKLYKEAQPAIIKIVGVGSGGVNAINTMIRSQVGGVEYIGVNTDVQHLAQCLADATLVLAGPTKGCGTGNDPNKGREAAIQEREAIEAMLRGANMVILATGLGGGTGTGATPVIAEIARSLGILTVAVVTTPFYWEGPVKQRRAIEGLEVLKENVDAYVVIPNDKLKKVTQERLKTPEWFCLVDKYLCEFVTGLVELITRPGHINRDFEDVKAVLSGCGLCVIGTAVGYGENRAEQAVEKALNNPLLEDTPVRNAENILVNIVQDPNDCYPDEIERAMLKINECMSKNCNLLFGLCYDERLEGGMKVTVIASGLGSYESARVSVSADMHQAIPVPVLPMDIETVDDLGERPKLGLSASGKRTQRDVSKHLLNERSSTLTFDERPSELEPTPAFLRVKAREGRLDMKPGPSEFGYMVPPDSGRPRW